MTVAVKQLSRSSGLGREELLKRVRLISECSHKNIVKFHGYCLEGDERLLVYEYLEKGSLHDALSGEPAISSPIVLLLNVNPAADYKTQCAYSQQVIDYSPSALYVGQGPNQQALAWPARFNIIVETAKGLTYLHQRKEGAIHGNIKAANVLLDEDFNPKLSDSCLSKLSTKTHNRVAGP